MTARKGQMFVATAVFLTGLLFFVQQALISYSILDLSSPFQSKEHYIVNNIIDAINRSITTTTDCLEFEDNLKELIAMCNEEFGKEGYLAEIYYDLNCSLWDNAPPLRAPLTLSIAFTGAYKASGLFFLYSLREGCARQNPTVSFSPPSRATRGGTTISYNVRITNNDNPDCGTSTFSLLASCPPGWACLLSESTVAINPPSTKPVRIEVTIPSSAAPGSYQIQLTAVNLGSPSYSGTGTGACIVE